MKHDEAVYIVKMDGRQTYNRGLFFVKKQSRRIKRCMEKKANFKHVHVVAGNGGFANSMVLRNVSLQGEKMSADRAGCEKFGLFTLDQIFNCDETVLNFHLLPESILLLLHLRIVSRLQRILKRKERGTVNACAKATATIKLWTPCRLFKVKHLRKHHYGFVASVAFCNAFCIDDPLPDHSSYSPFCYTHYLILWINASLIALCRI